MIWVACCTAFFGFLRSSEVTVPSQDAHDPTIHLSIKDVAVDNTSSPTIVLIRIVRIRIKQSKAVPFRQGVYIYLGRIDNNICPVKAILPYLALRDNVSGLLFMLKNWKILTR